MHLTEMQSGGDHLPSLRYGETGRSRLEPITCHSSLLTRDRGFMAVVAVAHSDVAWTSAQASLWA
jgi:hypothetical protein